MIPVAERLRLEKLLEMGLNLNALEERRVGENFQGFQADAQRIEQIILERLRQAEGSIEEFNADLEAIPFLEAEFGALEALMGVLIPLEEVQNGLYEKLEASEKELQLLQRNTQIMRTLAQNLKKTLEAGRGRYSFERPFNNAGEFVCRSVAKPYHS